MFAAAVSQERSPFLPALFWDLPHAATELRYAFLVSPCSRDGAGLGEQPLGSKIWECWVSVTGGGGAWEAPSVSFSRFLASDLFFFTRVLTPCPVSEHPTPHQSPAQGEILDQHPHLLSRVKSGSYLDLSVTVSSLLTTPALSAPVD